MKKKLSVILISALIFLLLPLMAGAEVVSSGTCGPNLTWTLDDAGTLTISGTGPMENFTYSAPWRSSPVKNVMIGEGVTSIGAYAFCFCDGMESITIPGSVNSIEEFAFAGCDKLVSFTIPGTVKTIKRRAFYTCSELRTVTLSEGIESIGAEAFMDCAELTDITIPGSVSDLGIFVFKNCSELTSATVKAQISGISFSSDFSDCQKLTHIYIPADHRYYASKDGVVFSKAGNELVFCPGGRSGEYTIPEGTASIGTYAFAHCAGLTGIVIPDTVQTINNYAFSYCTGLRSIKIPEGVTNLNLAFQECTNLSSVTLPETLTVLGNYSFYKCSSLSAITIPDSVRNIDAFTFLGCTSLKSITLPKALDNVSQSSFEGCTALSSVTIPDGISYIGPSAFRGCASLTRIALPDSVKSVKDYAFMDCSSLNYVSIPRKVTFIGTSAFQNCPLTEVRLSRYIEDIEANAFDKTVLIRVQEGSYAAAWASMNAYNYEFFPPEYDITITTNNRGKASADPVYGTEGTIVTLMATPDEDYYLKEWLVISGGVTITDNRFTIGKADVIIRAIFEYLDSVVYSEISPISQQIYTGKKIKPKLTVKYNGKTLVLNKDYTAAYSNNRNVGIATVTITGIGIYTGSKEASFTILPKKISLSSLKAGKNRLTVKWKKGSGIDGYEIEYSLTKDFSEAEKVTIKKAKTTSTVLKKLKPDSTYYVRIRAFKKAEGVIYYSEWSKVLKKKIK